MPTFSARRFKLPGSGSTEATVTMIRNQLSLKESKMRKYGLSVGELDQLISFATSAMNSLEDPKDRLALQTDIANYERQRDVIDEKRRGIDAEQGYFEEQKREVETQAKYMAGNDPVKYLTGIKAGYDGLLALYDENIKGKRETGDVTALALKRDELARETKEVAGILKTIDSKGDLSGVAYVVTPDATGGISDISIVPMRKTPSGALPTNVKTPEGLRVFVVPNRENLGKATASVGGYEFEEEELDFLKFREDMKKQGKGTAEITQRWQAELNNPNRKKTLKLKGESFDIGGLSMDPSIPDGDYGVGAGGIYKREGDNYKRIDANLKDLNLKPWQYRRLDSSIETAIQRQVTEVVKPQSYLPDSFVTQGRPSATGDNVQAPVAEEEAPAEMPSATPKEPPAQQQPKGKSLFYEKAKRIFSGLA